MDNLADHNLDKFYKKDINTDLYDKNSLRVDITWESYQKKFIINKIFSLIKWKANELISNDQIIWDFSMLKDKEKVILKELDEIKEEITIFRKLEKPSKEFLKYCFDKNIINEGYLFNSINKKLDKNLEKTIDRVVSPLVGFQYWETILIQDYHDIEHDLLEEEQNLLAYYLWEWLLSEENFSIIKNILKKWWDDIAYFLKNSYKKDFKIEYLKKYFDFLDLDTIDKNYTF